MTYLVDTDSLIGLRRTYSPRHFKQLWDDLEELISGGLLLSTAINFEELKVDEEDAVFLEWKKNHRNMFIEVDDAAQDKTSEILARFPNLIDAESVAEQADPFLIAVAIVKSGTVITEEKPLSLQAMTDPKTKRIKIPNVCQHYRVPCINVVQFVNLDEWRK